MIRNLWYGILDAKEIKVNKLYCVVRLGEKLVIWKSEDGKINCIFDKCCHRGASLSTGKLSHDTVRCPFHGLVYDASGKVIEIPANGKNASVPDRFKVNAYQVKEKYGFIWLWYGDYHAELPEIPFFESLRQGFSYGGFSEVWPVHYTRTIENQLDVVHLPFVHGNTIGRGCKTLVNGPVVKWQDNRMTFYVHNMIDDGVTKPLKPNEIENYKDYFSLQFQMPNIWQNKISPEVRIVAVFAPVDEENTRIYIRFYQSNIKLPVLKQVFNKLSNIGNRYILHQDRRVVLTQKPIKTELKMKENLIQGDLPIIEYRKRRAFLKGEVKSDNE
ncbi:MAG: Rieske 2Fe-2S domain-containing protein [Acetobacterium sp.]